MVAVQLANGKNISGILQEEKNDYIKIKVGDKPDTVLYRKDIRSQKNAMSSMPPMRLLLTKKEIRDVVSFLATLKED